MIDKTIGKRGKKEHRVCEHCKEEFIALSIKVRAGKEKYCSKDCYFLKRQFEKKKNKYRNEKRHQLKYKYGISLSDFEEMKTAQKHSCAICKDVFSSTPFVDHCHNTGKVRGLLCSNCNTGLGMFQDSEETLLSAIKYLNRIVAQPG